MVLGVYSANEVRKYINEQKYPYKGKHFNISKQTFYNIIRNVAYTGKIKVKEHKKEEEQIVTGLHPPIVSDDLFKRANDYLNGRVRKFDFKSDKTDLYPLKGFMKCSEHGRTITAYKCQSGNKNWYHYYLCTKPRCQRYRVDWAHEQIKKLLDKISFTAGMVKVYKSQLESLIDRDDVTRKTEIKRLETEIETCKTRQLNLQNSFLDCGISSSDFNQMKIRIESELNDKQIKLERLKSTKSPFKVYLNKTLPMIENLSHYWDKADGKTKKKILGCIFTEKFENFDFESCNNIFTPEIKSIMLASKVLRRNKNKKEVKNDLLSNMAPPLGLEPRTL
jgi:site-specific DNA recombinase